MVAINGLAVSLQEPVDYWPGPGQMYRFYMYYIVSRKLLDTFSTEKRRFSKSTALQPGSKSNALFEKSTFTSFLHCRNDDSSTQIPRLS